MFEKATRQKVRFNYKGLCTVEDLWDLSLQALDKIYRDLNSQKKEKDEVSLLNQQTKEEELLTLKLNLVKYVFETLMKEKQEKENEAVRAAKKQKILGIIEEKQEEDLRNKSVDELSELVNSL
jgi:hypothetical protein